MMVYQLHRVERLASAMAFTDDASGAIVDEHTSAILVEIGARLARVRTLLQEVLDPTMLAVIQREKEAFIAYLARQERREKREDRMVGV